MKYINAFAHVHLAIQQYVEYKRSSLQEVCSLQYIYIIQKV